MGLKEQIMSDVKQAMKAKQSEKLTVLRFVHSAIKNKEIDSRPNELTEADTLAVIKKLVKQHKDSIKQYEDANRADLAEKEQFELGIVETYLPEQMGEDQVRAIVEEVIASTGASSMKQMGAVMKQVSVRTAGNADNKLISDIVKSKLQ